MRWEKKGYFFLVPCILMWGSPRRKNNSISVFPRSMTSEKVSNRSKNDLLSVPNDKFEVGRCHEKVVPSQTDLEVKYSYNADEKDSATRQPGPWSGLAGLVGTVGGGTASGDAPRLQTYRLERLMGRFLIGWTLFLMPSTRETRWRYYFRA